MYQDMRRGVSAEIDLDAISHNLNVTKKISGSPVIAVVKADAYGHGAVEVSERLVKEGVFCLAVAYANEAIELRNAGIKAPILVLFEKCDIPDFFDYNLIPVIHDISTAKKISEEAKKRGHSIDVHVKIDTGMGRLGLNDERASEDIAMISNLNSINITGLMSHFSDSDISDKSYAEMQLKKFNAVRERLVAVAGRSVKNLLCHISNSAATVSFKDARLDAVRPGIMLYGCLPFQSTVSSQQSVIYEGTRGQVPALIPVMTVKTWILSLRRLPKGTPVSYGRTFITRRDSLIAVLPIGYADGVSRVFSNNADVLVRGEKVPVVGRVCMDITMVDVTEVDAIREGDEVVLLGRQGREEITAWDMALKSNTIPYEILISLGNRSKRIYNTTQVKQQRPPME